MRYDIKCPTCGHRAEVEKPIGDEYPRCSKCGGQMRREFNAPPTVHFAAPGFYSTDVQRMKSMVGSERFASFEHEANAARKRYHKTGLTPYERNLEIQMRKHA